MTFDSTAATNDELFVTLGQGHGRIATFSLGWKPMYMNVLIATDGSELANKGVKQGLALAEKLGAKVTFLSVVAPLAPEAIRAAMASGIPDPIGGYDQQIDVEMKKRYAALEQEAAQYGITVDVLHEIGRISGRGHRQGRRNEHLRSNSDGVSWTARIKKGSAGKSDRGGAGTYEYPGSCNPLIANNGADGLSSMIQQV